MKKKKGKIKFLIFSAAAVLLCVWYYDMCVAPLMFSCGAAHAEAAIRGAVSKSSRSVLSRFDSENLIVNSGSEDCPTLSINTLAVNNIALEICDESNKALNSPENSQISVSLGTMSGIVLLSNIGPRIYIGMVPAATVCHRYKTRAENVGTGQTHYRVSLEIFAAVKLILPGKSHISEITSEVVIADCIVTGKFPAHLTGLKTYDLIA